MILYSKATITGGLVILVLGTLQIFLVRYKMKSNLWLNGTNTIIFQETISQKNKCFTIDDPKIIRDFKKYFKNTRISYVYGAYARNYKVSLTNGKQKKVYGYTYKNHITDYGKSPGSLTLFVRIYEMDPSFESFIMSIINEKHFDFWSIQKSMLK